MDEEKAFEVGDTIGKEIHALGGDYVSVLLGGEGESQAVLAAKEKSA